MKKIASTYLIWLVFALSACTGSASTSGTSAAAATQTGANLQSSNPVTLSRSYANAAPVESQLLAGTFTLEGTNLAVTADQAKVLLPLWQQLQAISQKLGPGQGQGQIQATAASQSSRSDPETQINGLAKQIEAAMTAEQIQAIAKQQLDRHSGLHSDRFL